MAIEKMKKLRLLAVRDQKKALLRKLMLLGCIEVSEPELSELSPELRQHLAKEGSDITKCRTDCATLIQAVELLDKYVPQKSKLLSAKPETEVGTILDDSTLADTIETARRIVSVDESVRRGNAERARLAGAMDSLKPWLALDYPLDGQGTQRCAVTLGFVPASVPLAEAVQSLADVTEEAEIIPVSADKAQQYLALVCFKEDLAAALDALRVHNFSIAAFGNAEGTAAENTERLKAELEENIERGEQSILFINRRGANKLICCGDCGYVYKCPNCSVSLTYHSVNKRLICHYCGYTRRADSRCPDCGGMLTFVGAGTQLIEEELKQLYPDMQVLRMDTDTVKAAGSHDVLLNKFKAEKIPIMVGTQMVTKGLNFENVTLIGVVSADQSLYCGDYRSGERTFSLITQVIGRSGRGSKPGRAIIQTFTPQNEIIRLAAQQDYEGFFKTELSLRRLQDTPPFADIIAITASGTVESAVIKCCTDICTVVKASLRNRSDVRILGPAPLAVVRVNNRYRYRVNICCTADRQIREIISSVLIRCAKSGKYRGVSVFADNNPSD